MENKKKCKKCIHKNVCEQKSFFKNTEGFEKCKKYRGAVDNPCKICSGKEPVHTFIIHGSEDTKLNLFINETGFKYCPHCGRRLFDSFKVTPVLREESCK